MQLRILVFIGLFVGILAQQQSQNGSYIVAPELPYLRTNFTLNGIRISNVTTVANMIQGCAQGEGVDGIDQGQRVAAYSFNATTLSVNETVVTLSIGPECPGQQQNLTEAIDSWAQSLPQSISSSNNLTDGIAELDLCVPPDTNVTQNQVGFAGSQITVRRLLVNVNITRACGPSNFSTVQNQTQTQTQVSQAQGGVNQTGPLLGGVSSANQTVNFTIVSMHLQELQANLELLLANCTEVLGTNNASDMGLPSTVNWSSNNKTFEAARIRLGLTNQQPCSGNQSDSQQQPQSSLQFAASNVTVDRVNVVSHTRCYNLTAPLQSNNTSNVTKASQAVGGQAPLVDLNTMYFNGTNLNFTNVAFAATYDTVCLAQNQTQPVPPPPVQGAAQCSDLQNRSLSSSQNETQAFNVSIYQRPINYEAAQTLCQNCGGSLWTVPSPEAVQGLNITGPHWIGGVANTNTSNQCLVVLKPFIGPSACNSSYPAICQLQQPQQ